MGAVALKPSGIIRKVDTLGRIVIPQELRREHTILIGTPLEIFTDAAGNIVLKKYANSCPNCGSITEKLFGEVGICRKCITKLSKEIKVTKGGN